MMRAIRNIITGVCDALYTAVCLVGCVVAGERFSEVLGDEDDSEI